MSTVDPKNVPVATVAAPGGSTQPQSPPADTKPGLEKAAMSLLNVPVQDEKRTRSSSEDEFGEFTDFRATDTQAESEPHISFSSSDSYSALKVVEPFVLS